MPKNGQCRPAGQGTRLRPSCLSFRRRSPATIDSSSSHIPLPGMAQVRGRNLGARGEKPRWPPLFQRQKEWLAHCRLQPAPDCVEQRYGNVMRNCVAFAGSQCSLEAMCKVLGATPPVLCAPVLIFETAFTFYLCEIRLRPVVALLVPPLQSKSKGGGKSRRSRCYSQHMDARFLSRSVIATGQNLMRLGALRRFEKRKPTTTVIGKHIVKTV